MLVEKRIILYLFILFPLCVNAKNIYDWPDANLNELFCKKNTRYIIKYSHHFKDTLYIPYNSELKFCGGSLSGPIIFDKTLLRGEVNLIGSSIKGSLRNKKFNAAWLCKKDGSSDDASCINEILALCNNVYFPKGIYRLRSNFHPVDGEPSYFKYITRSHLVIYKDNTSLIGEDGATLLTDLPSGVIGVFSPINQIDKSVRNVSIKNITIKVHNDGINFNEFMHVIKFVGVNGALVERCFFDDFYGDAICLSHYGDTPETGERSRNKNVKIINNVIRGGEHHNNRNGISIVSGENILIKKNRILNTSRKDMPGGIDIEPNNSAYTIDNIIVKKNFIDGVWGFCGAISVVCYKGGSAYNIKIDGNIINNCSNGLHFFVSTNYTTSGFIVKNNYISDDTMPFSFDGGGHSSDWVFIGNKFLKKTMQNIPGRINIENLSYKNNIIFN